MYVDWFLFFGVLCVADLPAIQTDSGERGGGNLADASDLELQVYLYHPRDVIDP